MNIKKIAYWASTVLFVLPLTASAIFELTQSKEMVAGFQHLGYPLYLLTILGIAKALGIAALLFPRFPRLKEWAYAGFTFDLLGASASHAYSGDPVANVITPLVFLGLLAVSYWLYHHPESNKQAVLKPNLAG